MDKKMLVLILIKNFEIIHFLYENTSFVAYESLSIKSLLPSRVKDR